MQTLDVGAGRTDQEYEQAKRQRRADLLTESQSDANYFFWAAGLSALGTGLLPVRLNGFVNLGTVDLLGLYGRAFGPLLPYAVYGMAASWVVVLLGLGFAGRNAQRWAFLAGIALYLVDMMALMVLFSLWAFGIHAFFVFRWFQGQKALQDLKQAEG